MAEKLSWFKFYPGDWRKDVELSRVSKSAKGVWIDMLCLMFECPARGILADADGKPWCDEEVAQLIGGPQTQVLTHISELVAKGVARRNDRGAIFNARFVRDEQKRRKCSDAGILGGGNPTLKGDSKGHSKGDSKGSVKGVAKHPLDSSSGSGSGFDISGKRVQGETTQTAPEIQAATIPPKSEWVASYMAEIGVPTIEAEKFVDFYQSKGWLVGKVKMRDWKACCRNWQKGMSNATGNSNHRPNSPSARRAERAAKECDENLTL